MSNFQEHSHLHGIQVVQKGLSTNGGQTVTEKDRLYSMGNEITFDSRSRDATKFPNANNYQVDIPRIQKGLVRLEVKNLVVPGTPAGTENMIYFRLSVPGMNFERGSTADNFWYTVAMPTTNPDGSTRLTLKTNDSDNRSMFHFIPKHNIGNKINLSLWVYDTTTSTYVPYPFAADASDPAENYFAIVEFIAFH